MSPLFVKHERFLVRGGAPGPEVIASHIEWVTSLRQSGVHITSGYLVNGDGQPGGGGLLFLQASNFHEAEALIHQDPMLLSGGVEWSLQQWRPAVGDLGVI